MSKVIVVNRSEVVIDDKRLLRNHWYKFLASALQMIVDQNEMLFVNEIGEEQYENFYDLVDDCVTESNKSELLDVVFPQDIMAIGEQIEGILLGQYDSITINEKEIKLDSEIIINWSNTYFTKLILPYLQLDAGAEIEVSCSQIGLKSAFEMFLKNNGFISNDLSQEIQEVSEVEILEKSNDVVSCVGEKLFLVENDLIGYIPIDIRISLHKQERYEKQVLLYFPLYKKGDQIRVDVCNNDLKWELLAENENNHMKFRSEIELC